MRVLVLHSNVPHDAPPDEQDTLEQAADVASSLTRGGHDVVSAAFVPDPDALKALLEKTRAETVFNMVESVWGRALHAPLAAQMLEQLGLPFTGARSAPMALTGDKILSKRVLASGGLPTAEWCEAPFEGAGDGLWIVKSIDEDASLGLDAGSIVEGRDAIMARAAFCASRYQGRWFAERFIEGREFHVGLVEAGGAVRVLPIAEMAFPANRTVRIVTYEDKWASDGIEQTGRMRTFGWTDEGGLRSELEALARAAWEVFGLTGYARVDFRVDGAGAPFILEINANPCLDMHASLAAASPSGAGTFDGLIAHVLKAAR